MLQRKDRSVILSRDLAMSKDRRQRKHFVNNTMKYKRSIGDTFNTEMLKNYRKFWNV